MIRRSKNSTEYITGLDIGSTMIRIAVGQLSTGEDQSSRLHIVGIAEVPSEGVHKGNIVSIEDTVSAISHALESAEKMVGVPIEHAWVGVSGTQSIVVDSKGVIAIARTDGDITEEDVERSVEAAKTVAAPLNHEIIHVLPRSFAVDGQTGVKDPVGMTGIRLEVDTKIMYGLTSHLKNITKTVYRTGIDIDDFVLSILAVGDVVTTSRQKELGAVVVNIGGPTTSLVVYEEGDVIHTATIPIGSAHITNDLALGLKTSIDVAEQVKITYGHAVPAEISKKESIDISSIGGGENEIVSRFYVAQIIEARMTEILEKVNAELTKIQRNALLPAGALFVGGGAKLSGLTELAKNELQLPVALGYPLHVESITERVNDVACVAAVGLVKWGAHLSGKGVQKIGSFNVTGKIMDKMHQVFKSLVP